MTRACLELQPDLHQVPAILFTLAPPKIFSFFLFLISTPQIWYRPQESSCAVLVSSLILNSLISLDGPVHEASSSLPVFIVGMTRVVCRCRAPSAYRSRNARLNGEVPSQPGGGDLLEIVPLRPKLWPAFLKIRAEITFCATILRVKNLALHSRRSTGWGTTELALCLKTLDSESNGECSTPRSFISNT